MHRLYAIPYIALLLGALGLTLGESAAAATVMALSFVGCLACVPVLSRRHLGLGYASLIVPFAIAALVFLYWAPAMGDPKPHRPQPEPANAESVAPTQRP